MRYTIIVLSLVFLSTLASAQVNGDANTHPTELGQNVYGLGISGGLVSGFGLSFRQHFPSVFSYEIVGGIIKFDDRLHYNLGGTLQADVMRGDANRFYGCARIGYFYSGDPGVNELAGPFRFGIGAGNEMTGAAQFHINLEVMMTYFSDGVILPTPQVGAHYYFF
jgi:hypothetical protein